MLLNRVRVRGTRFLVAALLVVAGAAPLGAQSGEARLLRQPAMSATDIVFAHGGDLWIVGRAGGEARRLTSTAAVESDPHFSPDGRMVAFTSTRSGEPAVYVMAAAGGEPLRLTWYPAPAFARGWTPDGSSILYASSRESAPTSYHRLWTVPAAGGPSTRIDAPFGYRGSFDAAGGTLAVEPTTRWDEHWRGYRGGQNTPLLLLDLATLAERPVPNERTADTHPVWLDGTLYFISDRDWLSNIWSFEPGTGALAQLTRFDDADVRSLAAGPDALVFERDGWIHTLDPLSGAAQRVPITIPGDFPWAEPRWVDVGDAVASAGLSPSGQRALFEARGEIFSVPAEHGSVRNLTNSSAAADRRPIWSPDGERIAWFSDPGDGYRLIVAPQDGLGERREYSIGESVMAWAPAWSPDGRRIAFVDDAVRIRVLDLETGETVTADASGVLGDRNAPAPMWSPDSRWLAYAKHFENHLSRIVLWSVESRTATPITDAMAHAISPAWDAGGQYLWFLATTELGRAAGWANTSSIPTAPRYGAYLTVLGADERTPFELRSDEEVAEDPAEDEEEARDRSGSPEVRVDLEGIEQRIVAAPVPVRSYARLLTGPRGTAFLVEQVENEPGATLWRFTLDSREREQFASGVRNVAISADGERILLRSGDQWRIVGTARPPEGSAGRLTLALQARIEPATEWRQIFDEAWRYQRDFFYDPNTHGADWDAVYRRYAPLLEHVRHRDDLNYLLDQVNGELAVGHSFVRGGDLPETPDPRTAGLGADLEPDGGRWRFTRVLSHESWNPSLEAPLDQPGTQVSPGDYLIAVNGVDVTAADDPYRLLEGTRGVQTVLHINDAPTADGAWTVIVRPIGSETQLRQRAWVEDNRRMVDELSGGRLAYVWVPNTSQPGVVSFDRYYFSQQDRDGAVIDERFNGGGLLDDYMVDLMNREVRAAITNEAAGGQPMRLPAGVLGPKVLLINELAGSGGDYFPWIFSRLGIGPLIGTRTWGGLVASCAPYPMVDGGSVTAPCNAVFEPGGDWVAENVGVPPDIEVRMDARAVAEGRDPQLEAGVAEALRLLESGAAPAAVPPPYPAPARRP